VSYRGLRAGVAVTELGAGNPKFAAGNPASALYRYTKLNFSLGWESNFLALVHGNVLENRVAALKKQRDDLLAQIGEHQLRIAQLQGEIHRYEAQNLLELEERRAQAQNELETETDALHRLEDRLRRIESETEGSSGGSTSPASTAPPATPPSPPPSTPHNGEHAP
jgi:TolA-binding protein